MPLHFSAFHPDFQLTRPARHAARDAARRPTTSPARAGLKYVYVGNVYDRGAPEHVLPPLRNTGLIERDWYDSVRTTCGATVAATAAAAVAGRFDDRPGDLGPEAPAGRDRPVRPGPPERHQIDPGAPDEPTPELEPPGRRPSRLAGRLASRRLARSNSAAILQAPPSS